MFAAEIFEFKYNLNINIIFKDIRSYANKKILAF